MTHRLKIRFWPTVVVVIYALFGASVAAANTLSLTSDVGRIHEPKPFPAEDKSLAIAEDDFSAVTNATFPTSIVLGLFQNYTLTGGAGETVTLNLQNFILRGNSTFTLEGTATSSFVINVSRKFSLADAAKITLSGGVQVANIVFNVRGKGSVSLGGYSYLQGRLVAPSGKVNMRGHAIVYGWVSAKKLSIKQAAQIIHPPVISP